MFEENIKVSTVVEVLSATERVVPSSLVRIRKVLLEEHACRSL